jgi:endoglucanase
MMASKNVIELLVSLDNVYGISGEENPVAEKLKMELDGLYDEYYEDALGNQIYLHKAKPADGGQAPKKILLAAHMDELGLLVSYIEDNGLVRFVPVGWHDPRMVVDQDMLIFTRKGDVLQGVTGSKPAHILTLEEMAQAIPIADLYLDIGTRTREETLALGVRIGDNIGFDRQGHFLNGTSIYTGKSIDNRVGLAIMAEVLRRVSTEGIDHVDVYAVGSVQEEIGGRGAGAASVQIEPDVALALDVSLAGGSPGIEDARLPIKMGDGACILAYDWWDDTAMGTAVNKKLLYGLTDVAETKGIPHQIDVTMGSFTDAYVMTVSGKGAMAGGVFCPSRYIHTAVGTVDTKDMQPCVDLIVEYIKTL